MHTIAIAEIQFVVNKMSIYTWRKCIKLNKCTYNIMSTSFLHDWTADVKWQEFEECMSNTKHSYTGIYCEKQQCQNTTCKKKCNYNCENHIPLQSISREIPYHSFCTSILKSWHVRWEMQWLQKET